MRVSRLIPAAALWCLCLSQAQAQTQLQAQGNFLKTEFLVGEPVDLYVSVHNPWAHEVQVPHPQRVYEAFQIQGARILAPRNWQRFRFAGSPAAGGPREVVLGPGKWQVYRIRLVYGFPPQEAGGTEENPPEYRQGLLYPQPGEYAVMVKPKFYDPAPPSKGCYLDVVAGMRYRIRYPAPGTPEEKVWLQIRDPKVLAFIQTHGESGTPEVALKVAEVLRKVPGSRYHNGLQAVLGAYYRKHWEKHSVGQRALIDLALQRKFPPDVVPEKSLLTVFFLRKHAPRFAQELNVKVQRNPKGPASQDAAGKQKPPAAAGT